MEKPFFTIVYPAYNAEKTLSRAVLSMLENSKTSAEVLIIDDGSKDGTARIAEELAERFSEIRLIRHGENKGLHAARNTGLSEARGEYILFPDSDDCVLDGFLETIKDALPQKPELLIFGLTEEYYSSGRVTHKNTVLPPEAYAESKADVLRLIIPLEENLLLGYAWNKAYRVEFLRENKLQFENIRLVEDIVFNLAVIRAGARIKCLPLPIYNYAKRESSITGSSMPDYYPAHLRRAEELYKTVTCLGGGDTELSRVALRWVRFVLSAISRQNNAAAMKEMLMSIFNSDEYKRFSPFLTISHGNAMERALARAILGKKENELTLMAKAVKTARRVPKLFTRIKRKPQGKESVKG